MSLASENSTPMEEDEVTTTVTVVGDGGVKGNIIGSASSPRPSRSELYQVIRRLFEIRRSFVDLDMNEFTNIWNRIMRLDGYYGTFKSLGALYFSLVSLYGYRRGVYMDTAVLDQIRDLMSEASDCVRALCFAEESSAIDATINFGMSLKEFVDLMSQVEGAIPFVNSILHTRPEKAIEIWSNIKKLEEFERSFLPHECRGMVESLRTQFSSKLRDSASVYNYFPMTSSHLRSKDIFLALLKEVNGDKDLEGALVATGFRDISSGIMRLREDDCFYRKCNLNVEVLISKFNSLLKNFISNEMLPKDLSDFSFIEDCRQLLRQVDDYTDLEGAWTSADSVGQASSNGGISNLGDPSHPTLGGNHMSEQDVKLKSFDKFAQWATALFLAILIGFTGSKCEASSSSVQIV